MAGDNWAFLLLRVLLCSAGSATPKRQTEVWEVQKLCSGEYKALAHKAGEQGTAARLEPSKQGKVQRICAAVYGQEEG
jgi:hypothetical protein